MMAWNFPKSGGYKFSHLIIEYLLDAYGKDNFLKWLQNPNEFIDNLDEIDYSYHNYIIQKIEARIG